jgi:hypothetical protein
VFFLYGSPPEENADCYKAGARRRRRYFAAATQILDEAIGLGARA